MATGLLSDPGGGARADCKAADADSRRVQAALRAYWKQTMRRRPPAEREAWLKQVEVQAALGATVCRQRVEAIASEKDRVAQMMCSGAWVAAWESTGCAMPIECDDAGRTIPLVEWPLPGARRSGGFRHSLQVRIIAPVGAGNGVGNVRLGADGKTPRRLPDGRLHDAGGHGGRVRVGDGRRELFQSVLVPAYCPVNLSRPGRRRDRVSPANELERGRRPDPMRLGRHGVRYGVEHSAGGPVDTEPTAGPARRR